jgi:hypothetical protein
MEEFSHKCWGPKAPYTHPAGKYPINGAYTAPEVDIAHLNMLIFIESPGNHRSLCFDFSTCFLLGKLGYKICCPVSRCLVTSQQPSIRRYNAIVCEQFEMHHIAERMEAIDKMTRYCGYPSPGWLRGMIINCTNR